jgi:iron complex outermembrane receptor protein
MAKSDNPSVRRMLLAATALVGMAHAASAKPGSPSGVRPFHIAAQDLGTSLRAVGRIGGTDIMFPADAVMGKQAPALDGQFTVREAVERLLAGSGLSAVEQDGAVLIRGRATPPGENTPQASGGTDIVVTGSRIRGAPIASPVISITQKQMRDAGENRLADVIRDIPQNAGGGQNIGVGNNVPAQNGVNLGSASTINLRGLGSDATLTLLNGHRLAYNITRQGIDISAIPIAAVDRLEIVADGASALYGSDAVAGVANIVLKRDYNGLSTLARLGASTDGGNEQQQYSIVAGRTWSTGGFMTAYDFERDTAIISRERSYSATQTGLTLVPPSQHHNIVLTGHQAITDTLHIDVDAFYNRRRSDYGYALSAGADDRSNGVINLAKSSSFVVAPSATLALPDGWRAQLATMIGQDRSHYGVDQYLAGTAISTTRGCYCNTAKSAEISTDGSLFTLPGGPAKLALGGGIRTNAFHGYRTAGAAQDISVSQNVYYGYGELSLPLISADQNIPFVRRLNLSGAMRYEDYPGIDHVLTPKLGIVYSPSDDLDIKGSWGRSFKAPTLYQSFNSKSALLLPAIALGARGASAGATAILLLGGNSDLKPERAETWSATLVAHPVALPGAKLEISYFGVKYRDRVVQPISFLSNALSDPIYADLIISTPSTAAQAAALAGSTFLNASGGAYDPSKVVAIADNLNLNVARQTIYGIDIAAQYRFTLRSHGTITASASMSYLHSAQRLSARQPLLELAGTLFSPPHVRGRAGLSWTDDALTLTGFVNYIGGVSDTRSSPALPVRSMTTGDLTALYKIMTGPTFARGLGLSVSIDNVFNAKPGHVRIINPYDQPYDSTNYTPVGRFVSCTVSKDW